jgi:hypothetical protein
MPNHLHLAHALDLRRAVSRALADHAQWVNHGRGESGALWLPRPPPEPVEGRGKQRRVERYIHLNPCRAGAG